MKAASSAGRYVGRFAPSPTGPLHFGSMVAAVGSYLEARRHDGDWLLRIEDVDEPRCSRSAANDIVATLAAAGFEWDGGVMWQSARKSRYREMLDRLQGEGMVFPCACTRRELADSAVAVDGAHVYPGTCRPGLPEGRAARAWRARVDAGEICFDDAVQGRVCQTLSRDVGDFVLLRADGLFAYQLAVVVDDADQGVTHVVRGADLLESTPRQIFLQRRLGVATPQYAHLPVVVDAAGRKLSKQTLAAPVPPDRPTPALARAAAFLGQQPPVDLGRAGVHEFWEWARDHWEFGRVPRRRTMMASA